MAAIIRDPTRVVIASVSGVGPLTGSVDLRGGTTNDPCWEVRVVFPDGVTLAVFRQTDRDDASRVASALREALQAHRP